jgi:DNA-binding Lrp family transcriptional regulator
MFQAYVLITMGAADPDNALQEIRGLKGVKQAHHVLGPTDCIAFVEGPDLNGVLGSVRGIRRVEGVEATDTRVALS